ncbi:MAG: hypothetical protein JSV41_05545, partial [Gemmatimonadota bacterium]
MKVKVVIPSVPGVVGEVTINSTNDAVAADDLIPFAPFDPDLCGVALVDVLGEGTTQLVLGNTLGFSNGPARMLQVIGPISLIVQLEHAVVEPGEVQQVTVLGDFGGGVGTRDMTSLVTFASSNPSVADVDANGVVTAGAVTGTAQATITASYAGTIPVQGQAVVTVIEGLVKIAFLVGDSNQDWTNTVDPTGDVAMRQYLESFNAVGVPQSGDAVGPNRFELVAPPAGRPIRVDAIDDNTDDPSEVADSYDLLIISAGVYHEAYRANDRVDGDYRHTNIPKVYCEADLNEPCREAMTSAWLTEDLQNNIWVMAAAIGHPIFEGVTATAGATLMVFDLGDESLINEADYRSGLPLSQGVEVLAESPNIEYVATIMAVDADNPPGAPASRYDDGSPFLARHVSLFISDGTFQNLNDDGKTLFTNSVAWAIRGQRLPVTGWPISLGGGESWETIGSGCMDGAVSTAAGCLTITGGGADIWDLSDGFTYVHLDAPVVGDWAVEFDVTWVGTPAEPDWSKAMGMAREWTSAGSRHVSCGI